MKFLVVKNLQQDKGFRPLIIGVSLFSLLYLVVDIYVKSKTFGLTLAPLLENLYGNEEEYIDAMEASVFLEYLHLDIFIMMMLLLTITAIYIRFTATQKRNLFIANTTLITALLSLILLTLSFYINEVFIIPYLICFWFWHVGAFWMSIHTLKRLFIAKRI